MILSRVYNKAEMKTPLIYGIGRKVILSNNGDFLVKYPSKREDASEERCFPIESMPSKIYTVTKNSESARLDLPIAKPNFIIRSE